MIAERDLGQAIMEAESEPDDARRLERKLDLILDFLGDLEPLLKKARRFAERI